MGASVAQQARWRSPRVRRLVGVVGLLLLIVGPRPAWADPGVGTIQVTVENGRMTARVVDAPLGAALAAVARAAQIKVEMRGQLDERVSLRVTDVDLEDGVRRLLRGQSYALTRTGLGPASTESGRPLMEIVVMGRGQPVATASSPAEASARRDMMQIAPGLAEIGTGAPPKPPAGGSGPSITAWERSRAALWAPLAQERVVALRALATRARRQGETGGAREIVLAALEDPDESVRAAALEVIALPRGPAVPVETIARLAQQDPSPTIRRQAVRRLAEMSQAEARRALWSSLSDPDPTVREFAGTALESIQAP